MIPDPFREAYIKVCEGYKEGKPIEFLIKNYLYGLYPEDEYPSLSFDQWLFWACKESHDDPSNPVLILCMAEYMRRELGEARYGTPINKPTSAAFAVIDTINWFSLDNNTPPMSIISCAVHYLFNGEDINAIISDAYVPDSLSSISRLPDCGVEYFSRKDLIEACAAEEKEYLLHVCGINSDTPF